MNLLWIGLFVFAPLLVMLFMLGMCRSAGMADDALDQLRANNYRGRVSLDSPRYSEPVTTPLKSTPIQS